MKQDKKAKWKKQYNTVWKHVLWLLPFYIVWFILSVYPQLQVFPMAFFKWNPITNVKEYVGWHYFDIMFNLRLEDTMRNTWNTVLYVIYLLVIQSVLAMILTVALRKNTRHNRLMRAFFFMPMVFSGSMVCLTWTFMYDPNLGVLNNIMALFDPTNYPGFSFFGTNAIAVLCAVIVHIWHNMGHPITILTSGFNTVEADLAEAARVDGATKWQSFWRIEIPLMLPTIMRMILLTILTGAMASSYQVLLGNMSEVADYDTIGSLLYKSILNNPTDYGPICALSVCMFFVVGALTLLQFVSLRKIEDKILG